MTDSEHYPRPMKCDGCHRIYIKNDSREKWCSSCARAHVRRVKDAGTAICGHCLKDFQRKVMRQRFCSEECRKGGSGAVRYG